MNVAVNKNPSYITNFNKEMSERRLNDKQVKA